MSAHTPTPWHVNAYTYIHDDSAPTGRRVCLCSPDSNMAEGYTINAANVQICQINRHTRGADAALIVRAVNAHDDLVAALRHAQQLAWEVGCETDGDEYTLLADSRGDLWREITAALVKAEGHT